MPGMKISGMGVCIPEKVMTNEMLSFELEQRIRELQKEGLIQVDEETLREKFLTDDQWIQQRAGIKARHIAASEQATSDLAKEAAQAALNMAGLRKDRLEAVILATVTPDYRISPSTAPIIQDKLSLPVRVNEELRDFFPCDVTSACSSFLTGLYTAYGLIKSGLRKNVLLVGADKMSAVLNWYDRSTCMIFGDMGAAWVLEATPEDKDWFRPEWFFAGADGSFADRIMTKKGGSASPLKKGDLDHPLQREDLVAMQGHKVFEEITRLVSREVLPQALKKFQLTLEEIDVMILHQANIRINDSVIKKIGFKGRIYNNLDFYGNTTSASVPSCVYEAWLQGIIRQGDRVMLVVFGGGYTWLVVAFNWLMIDAATYTLFFGTP